jgi:hypothetical protein
MRRSNTWISLLAIGAIGCERKVDGDDVEGFQLIEAEFADDFSTLVLTFSDPVASVDGVAPTDFRISMGQTFHYTYDGQYYAQSAYYDPNTWIGSYPVGMMAIANGPRAEQISITLAPRFEPLVCTAVANSNEGSMPDFPIEAAVFPHYAPGTTPVTNTDGAELAAMGAEWVLTGPDDEYYGYEMFVDGFRFPNLIPQIPILCPP